MIAKRHADTHSKGGAYILLTSLKFTVARLAKEGIVGLG
jgi:hypothetical protein